MYSLVKSAPISFLVLCLLLVTAFAQGDPIPASSAVSGQKLGSVLVYNFYTARANEETDISLTNTNATDSVAVHLFFVNGTTNQAADTFVTLAPRQTVSLLASTTDPGNAGYVVAVAVDATSGCPRSFNYLGGDAYLKLASGLMTSLPAEAFAALYGGALGACNAGSTTATLAFDGSSYNEAPRALALDSVMSLLDSNSTLMVVNRLGGSLVFGANAAPLGASEGVLYHEIGDSYNFTFSASNTQFRSFFSPTFPIVPDGFNNVIPAGVTGYMKLWPTNDAGILGALLNFNPNASGSPLSYSGGHNLRYLTVGSSATLTIPVYPPSLKADLSLSLAHTGSFTVGSTGDYTLSVSNAALAKPATGTIKITDTLPSNLTLQSFSGAGWNCTVTVPANVSCTNSSGLAAGASLPTLTLTVNIGAGSPASITNTATVSVAPQQESNLTNNSASDSTNSPPTISPLPVLRTAGSPSTNSVIANVNDTEDAKNTLTVTVNGSATINGVTVSGISVDSAGVVTANVVAACGAATASFTLMVTDSGGLSTTATLNVTVNVNSQPTLGTYLNTSVDAGGNTTVTPTATPTDNGTLSITASAPGFTGSFIVNPATGVVTITNPGPIGYYIVTVTATDNCGSIGGTTDASFTLNVACANLIVSNNANGGTGSLREAIANACAGSTITFANTVTSPITLASELVINKNLTILGPGANLLTISGNNNSRVFSITAATVVTIDGLTITKGNGQGAASPGNGGGIFNAGKLNLTNSAVTNSTIGGIYNRGMLTLNRSIVSGNLAGSGISNFYGSLTVVNSTISGNRSTTGYGGGGILNFSGFAGNATTTVINSTIAENKADAPPGFQGRGDAIADAFSPPSSITVKNSILASPSQGLGDDCYISAGVLTSLGYNIVSDNSGGLSGTGDMNNTNPLLGPLANNGGPTQTMALIAGSPAIDKGSAATGVTTDQRGQTRPLDFAFIANATGGNGSDIGAVEAQTLLEPPTITAASQLTRRRGSAPTNSLIATVSDTTAGTLTVTATTPDVLTVNNIVNIGGTVTADVAARCDLTPGYYKTILLTVTNGTTGLSSTADLIVYRTDNTPPTLVYPTSVTVSNGINGVGQTITPTVRSDNGTITGFSLLSTLNPGDLSVNQATGVVKVEKPLQPGTYSVTITATDNCDAIRVFTFLLMVNRPPLIGGIPVQRQSGSPPQSSSIIANVNDLEDAVNTLLVKVNGNATVNGVTVSNISVDTFGRVWANVLAACNNAPNTTDTTFTLMVTDSGGLSSTAPFKVTVSPNTPPTLGYYLPTTIFLSSSAPVEVKHLGPPPSDNGTISSMTVAAPGVPGNNLSVNPNTGNVKITKAGMPIGERTVTVTAIDNCGAKTTRDFKVNVKF